MTIFNIANENIERWFNFDDGGKIQLKIPTEDDWKEIRRQTVKKGVDYKRIDGKAERFEYEKIDENLQFELFWDLVIIDWKNLYFDEKKQKPIACNKDNKLALVKRSKKFIDKVNEFLEILRTEEIERAEEAPKN